MTSARSGSGLRSSSALAAMIMPRRAEAALGGEAVGEGLLQRMQPAVGAEPLERLDGGAVDALAPA